MEQTNEKIRYSEALFTNIAEVDFDLIRKKNIVDVKEYRTIDKIYKREKLSHYSMIHYLEELENELDREETNINIMKKKSELVKTLLDQTMIEIEYVKNEHNILLKENNNLKTNIADVQVPTVIDYAYTIRRRKVIQREIDIWTKKVNTAEVSLNLKLRFFHFLNISNLLICMYICIYYFVLKK